MECNLALLSSGPIFQLLRTLQAQVLAAEPGSGRWEDILRRGLTCPPPTGTHRPSPPRRSCHHWQARHKVMLYHGCSQANMLASAAAQQYRGVKRICPGWTWSPSTDKTDRTLAASPEHSAQFTPPHLYLSCLLAALCLSSSPNPAHSWKQG